MRTMRWTLLLILLAGCDSKQAPPNPATFDAIAQDPPTEVKLACDRSSASADIDLLDGALGVPSVENVSAGLTVTGRREPDDAPVDLGGNGFLVSEGFVLDIAIAPELDGESYEGTFDFVWENHRVKPPTRLTHRITVRRDCSQSSPSPEARVVTLAGVRPVYAEFVPPAFPWGGAPVLAVGLEDETGMFAGGVAMVNRETGAVEERIEAASQYGLMTLRFGTDLQLLAGTFTTMYNPDIRAWGALLLYRNLDFRDYERISDSDAYGLDVNSGSAYRYAYDPQTGRLTSTTRASAEPTAGTARCVTFDPADDTVFLGTRGASPKICVAPPGVAVAGAQGDLPAEPLSIEYRAGRLWAAIPSLDLVVGYRWDRGALASSTPDVQLATGDEPVDLASVNLGNGYAALWTVDRQGPGGLAVVWDAATGSVEYSGAYELPDGCSGGTSIVVSADETEVCGTCPEAGKVWWIPMEEWLDRTIPQLYRPMR